MLHISAPTQDELEPFPTIPVILGSVFGIVFLVLGVLLEYYCLIYIFAQAMLPAWNTYIICRLRCVCLTFHNKQENICGLLSVDCSSYQSWSVWRRYVSTCPITASSTPVDFHLWVQLNDLYYIGNMMQSSLHKMFHCSFQVSVIPARLSISKTPGSIPTSTTCELCFWVDVNLIIWLRLSACPRSPSVMRTLTLQHLISAIPIYICKQLLLLQLLRTLLRLNWF